MRNAMQSRTTRRSFLVRSAATAAGAYLSINLPGLTNDARAASSAAASGYTRHCRIKALARKFPVFFNKFFYALPFLP